MLCSLSSEEITEWAAYYQLDPFDNRRGDFQAALIAMWICQVNAKPGKIMKLKDFILDFSSDETTETITNQQQAHDALKARFMRFSNG